MEYQAIFSSAFSAAGIFVIAAVGRLLVSSVTTDAIKAFAAKLSAETEHFVADADTKNNFLIQDAIHAAMQYAENHQANALKAFDSKADYVIAMIDADPRFAHLNLPLSAIKHQIELLYTTYFADLQSPAPQAVVVPVPGDITGGPGGK